MPEEIKIEDLLARIQAYLDTRQGTTQPGGRGVSIRPRGAFSAEVYERLEEAEVIAEAVHVTPFLTPVHLPIVGALWQRIRGAAHDLAIFYVNRLAGAQAAFNREVVAGWAALVDDLDRGGRANSADDLASLRAEVAALRDQVAALRAQDETRPAGRT